ncbi:N(6)-adenine-specific methyltransferase METTL4 [Dryobates pubescens]|uniref:N(6)-adenine-specific methyltransferase METTL4 n=1 Tax=Dryobates pubescens TaxID=118200 RepID=UPI0023B9F42F|nr:N(6)-adenine-specific methyltransferase METTL4 [Dryobates pubescens]
MAVVHRLAAGWLVDHLAFINQCGYEIWDSSACPAAATSAGACCAAPAGSWGRAGPEPGPAAGRAAGGQAARRRFVFREEFFAVSQPHIAAAPGEQLRQGCPALSPAAAEAQSSREELPAGAQSAVGGSAGSARKKRKRQQELNQGELEALHYHCKVRKLIWEGSLALVQEGLRSGFLQPSAAALGPKRRAVPGHGGCGLAELCDMGKQLPAGGGCLQPAVQLLGEESSLPEQALLSCLTENSSSSARILVLMGQKYLVPPRSSFLLSDVSCLQPLLSCQRRFEVIVLDPPWENKSLKRSKSYSPLAPWQIKQLPVPALAAPSCLVLTWVTNRQRHLRFVREQLYPHWALQPLAEWYWVKITRAGEFVLPLDSLHKKPYEVLVLGRAGAAPQEASREAEAVPEIPAQKLIVSVPCSLHSHKPPLAGVLAEFVKPDVQCLELFARSLQPGWTSWGNEVLKFQHMDYFTPLGDES